MRVFAFLAIVATALLAPLPAAAQYGNVTIRCESIDFRRQFCPADTDLGVRLVRQTSRAECIRGRTWWRDERGIVVTEGCGGEFEIGYRDTGYTWPPATGGGGYHRPETLRCESRDYRRRYCPADVGYGAVALQRQLSDTRCVYGRNWAYDRRGVWVEDGCAGVFEIGYQDNAWRPGNNAQWVRCESRDYQQNYCATGSSRDAFLVRQISRAPCIEGQSWGRDRRGIWVSNGCAADFEVR
jgi:hypothetical protein